MMAAATKVVKPAPGPETASWEPLISETTIQPIIPERSPAYRGAPDARAIPKQSGNATRKTESPAGKSCLNQIMR